MYAETAYVGSGLQSAPVPGRRTRRRTYLASYCDRSRLTTRKVRRNRLTFAIVDLRTAALTELVDSLYSVSDIPELLFHYTSTSGLLGILEARALWASELRYLNDSAELTYGYQLLLSEVRARTRSSSQHAEVLAQLEHWLEHRSRFGPMVFVAAFTGNGNLLSQWRAYCPPAGGVSFGVASDHLDKVCKNNQFSLARCIYSTDEHRQLVEQLIEHIVSAADSAGPNTLAPSEESFHPVFYALEESLIRVCAVLKHSAFQEEAEWRAVSSAFSDFVKGEGAKINYRAGSSMLVPYVLLPLADSNSIVPVEDVITGPTPDPVAATQSVQRLVAKHISHLHGPWKSRYCDIPYRSW